METREAIESAESESFQKFIVTFPSSRRHKRSCSQKERQFFICFQEI